MPSLSSPPLGTPIPGSAHSVSCSLPTMRDVVGYEEKDPAVTSRLNAGYPRFAMHPFVQELTRTLRSRAGKPGEHLWTVLTPRVAEELVKHLGTGRAPIVDGVAVVAHAGDPTLTSRAKLFLQHTGGLISSRAAEDALVNLGLRESAGAESTFEGDAAAEVKRILGGCFPGVPATHLHLGPSGMGAITAAFEAINAVQRPRGRTVWVQLGWLYLDTIAILKKFTANPAGDYRCIVDVRDFAALGKMFETEGTRIAGVIAEAPTNPLVQTPDLPRIAALARKHGARMIVDPAIASPFNVDVLAHADIAAFSLTKYASHAGDVMAGAAVVNAGVLQRLDLLYRRDLARLAFEIGDAPRVVAGINRNTPQVVRFLESHPNVDKVWWSLQADTAQNYRRIARTPESVGAVISFTLRGDLARFYDRVELPKGPSFGMSTTLLCPYIYLAHYDILPTRSSSSELKDAGLSPDLIRLSVGTEPADEIIAALNAALR
jgi:cystathionine gamma-synthase